MHQGRKVRAVARMPYGSMERSAWYPEGSPEAVAAMEALAKKQTGIDAIGWEWWNENMGSTGSDDGSDKISWSS